MIQQTSSTTENTTYISQVLIGHPACLPLVPVMFLGYKYGFPKMEVSQNAFPDRAQEYILQKHSCCLSMKRHCALALEISEELKRI